jgi:hypothetical protein
VSVQQSAAGERGEQEVKSFPFPCRCVAQLSQARVEKGNGFSRVIVMRLCFKKKAEGGGVGQAVEGLLRK